MNVASCLAKGLRSWSWLSVLALVACAAENPASLRLNGNLVVTRTDKTLNLCYPIQAQAFRTVGVLDLMSLSSTFGEYTYYASVDNLLQSIDVPSGGNKESQLRSPKSSTVTITGVTAALVDNEDGTQLPKDYKSSKMPVTAVNVVVGPESPLTAQVGWSSPASQVVEPQGKALFPVTLVPANVFTEWWKVFNALAPDVRGKRVDRLTVRLALTGKLADGTAVASGSVDYPLQVCWGCLMVVPIDPTAETPADSAKACVATSVPSDYIVSCVPGQDEFQPCQQYCQFCRTRELAGAKANTQGACDQRFCPTLTEEDMVKFKLK